MDKKNFLFVSLTGLISDIAWQVSKEGHEVRYFRGRARRRNSQCCNTRLAYCFAFRGIRDYSGVLPGPSG